MSDINSNLAQKVINAAQQEFEEELQNKNVVIYKALLKKKHLAKVALENISREVEDAEKAMRQGNEIV